MKYLRKLLSSYLKPFREVSYSQLGEDRILEHVFKGKNEGVYIDIGANDPIVYSNTYLLYQKGWHGLCIDPNPQFQEDYKKVRPKDTFVNSAVGNSNASVYFQMNEDHRTSKIVDVMDQNTKEIKTVPLNEIIETNNLHDKIDLMNIDVEGYELQVLESLSFDKHSPEVILIEIHNNSLDELSKDEVYKYLCSKGYELFAVTIITAFFRKKH